MNDIQESLLVLQDLVIDAVKKNAQQYGFKGNWQRLFDSVLQTPPEHLFRQFTPEQIDQFILGQEKIPKRFTTLRGDLENGQGKVESDLHLLKESGRPKGLLVGSQGHHLEEYKSNRKALSTQDTVMTVKTITRQKML